MYYYTYILRSLSHLEQRYIGSTSDLRSRLAKHNAGEVPHTSKFKPWKAESNFAFETKEKAAAFEAYLKTGQDTPSPTATSEPPSSLRDLCYYGICLAKKILLCILTA